jgi:hypothetical protein
LKKPEDSFAFQKFNYIHNNLAAPDEYAEANIAKQKYTKRKANASNLRQRRGRFNVSKSMGIFLESH